MLAHIENKLFAEWVRCLELPENKFFIKDGVVDENEWEETPFNILFLLKEVNGGDCEWDERDYLARYFQEEKYVKTHSPSIDTILLWLYGLFHYSSDTPWEQVLSQQSQEHKEWLLRQIALVNIKKTPGAAVADMKDIDAFFRVFVNQMFLKKQLSLYYADLVVCGGTAIYLKQLGGCYAAENWKTTHTGLEYLRIDETIYLSFVHPLARVPKNILFYSLLEGVEEIERIEKLDWGERRYLELP